MALARFAGRFVLFLHNLGVFDQRSKPCQRKGQGRFTRRAGWLAMCDRIPSGCARGSRVGSEYATTRRPRSRRTRARVHSRFSAYSTRVLILSAHGDPEYVEQVVLLGGAGYLIKQTSADILVEAIREVYKGKSFFTHRSPISSRTLSEHPHTAGLRKRKEECLTSREDGVLQLIAEGKTNKQIASELGMVSNRGKASSASHAEAATFTTLRVLLVTPSPRELLKAAFNRRRMAGASLL